MSPSEIVAAFTGEWSMSKRTDGGRERPSAEEIARLAYYFYEIRGKRDGRDLDDWLMAEHELARHYR